MESALKTNSCRKPYIFNKKQCIKERTEPISCLLTSIRTLKNNLCRAYASLGHGVLVIRWLIVTLKTLRSALEN